MESKLLVLLRHAKSSWADPSIPDHDRPLNGRGRDAAARVGRHLRRDGPRPELVLCSSSTRTRQTLELLELRPRPVVLVEDGIYGATASGLLTRVREVPARYGTVLVIGHNPGVEDLARLMDERGLSTAGEIPDRGARGAGVCRRRLGQLEPAGGAAGLLSHAATAGLLASP
jgi:phosphohistidine phosphatase SixA